jgi:purine-binding chemotaxis protein CheW
MREEFLAFELGDELYAVPIGKVREIVGGAPRLTPIPNAPAFLKGLISLRGDVLPLVDLRKEFGLPTPPYDRFTVVILAEVVGVMVGVVVDRVVDVLAFEPGEIHPPPSGLSVRVRTEFVRGLGQWSERLVVVLDLDSILTHDEIGILRGAGAG